jgi:hypothetical protein
MATWTTIPTPYTGSTIATAWGTAVKAASDITGQGRPACHISRTVGSGGVIASGAGTLSAATVVNLDTAQYDNDAMFSGNAVHIRTAGTWLVMLSAEWVNTGTAGLRSCAIWESTGSRWIASESKLGSIGISTYHHLYALELFDTNDVLSPKVAQSSGTTTYFAANNYGLAINCILVSG